MIVTDPNVELWFEDEAHIGRNTTVTQMWAPINVVRGWLFTRRHRPSRTSSSGG